MLRHLKSLAGQSAVYGLGNLLTQAIQVFLVPIYTQFLTPADYGVMAMSDTFNAIVGIALTFGLQNAVTRFHYDYLDNDDERRAYYGTLWIFITVAALVFTLAIDWQGDRIFRLLFPDVPFQPYGRLAVWLSYLTITSVIPLILFRVREQPQIYILFTVSRFLVQSVAVIVFVVGLRQGAEGSLKGRLLAAALFAIPFTVVSLRNSRLTFHLKKLKASLAFGVPMIPHQLSGWALQASDRIVLAQYVTADQVGLYSLGYRVANMLDMILLSINMAWSPFFYRTAATDKEAPQTFARLTTYYAVALLTLCLGTALLARDVIALIAKPAFHPAYRVVPVVVLAFLAHGFYFIVVNQLFFTKQTKRLPIYTAISAGTNIALNVLTVRTFGIMAAAWNTTIGYVLLFVLTFWESNRRYPIPYEYGRLARLTVAAGGTYVVGSLVNLGHPLLSLAARLLVIAAFPAALFLFRFFTPREISGMRLLLARVWPRAGKQAAP